MGGCDEYRHALDAQKAGLEVRHDGYGVVMKALSASVAEPSETGSVSHA